MLYMERLSIFHQSLCIHVLFYLNIWIVVIKKTKQNSFELSASFISINHIKYSNISVVYILHNLLISS